MIRAEAVNNLIRQIDDWIWGPVLLTLLLGTGIFLMVNMDFLPLRNLGWALKCALGAKEDNSGKHEKKHKTKFKTEHKTKEGEISPFSSLMTELAATIGTGNIVGVATAMVLGGPGALVWMILSSLIGLSTKLSESLLSVKYRTRNEKGEPVGGPMYTLAKAFPIKGLGQILGKAFALFAVFASFGMGNMTQSNSIASVMEETFQVSRPLTGLVITLITILVVLGGISAISKVTRVMVPAMAIFYILGSLSVILLHWENIPGGLWMILTMAFSPRAVAGGAGGHLVANGLQAFRWGVSRGVFSNEAGLGAAGISAAAAETDDPVRQGYISMTGVFLDTVVICTITGLVLACSGALGKLDESGKPLTGTGLTVEAFATTFGDMGEVLVSIGISLFALATIIGWAYQGEKAFEFLVKKPQFCIIYRFLYGFVSFIGAVCALDVVWDFSDICNGLMAVPNLICLLALSGEVCREVRRYGKR